MRHALLAAACAAAFLLGAAPADAAGFKNCAALNKVYKHGVGKPGAKDRSSRPVTNFKRSTALYNANKGKDRDKDGIACEKR